MKLFYNFSGSMLSAVKRFPAVFLLTFCAAASFALESLWLDILDVQGIDNTDLKHVMLTLQAMGMASLWSAVLSFPVQLLAELSSKKLLQTLAQIFSLVSCFAWYFICLNTGDKWMLLYFSTLIALISVCPFMLKNIQNNNEIVLNIISSLFQSFLISLSITVALIIIQFSISTLFGLSDKLRSFIFTPLYFLCWITIFIDYFVINVSRYHFDITIPRFMGVLFSAVLAPLFAIFIVVLYAYLIKCAAFHSFPMREMNMFCSIATALFILFELTLSYFDTKSSRIFYTAAPFAVMPLIIVQLIITVDRVKAHGISMNRYASMLYILISIAAVILSIIKHRQYLMHICHVFAITALIAGITPFNLIDVPLRSQTKIIYSTLERNGLYKDGNILKNKTMEVLSSDDKNTIIRAYNKIKNIDINPFKDFEKTFGFHIDNYTKVTKNKYSYRIYVPKSNIAINISSYSQMYELDYEIENGRILLNYAGNTLDITDTVKKYLAQNGEPNNNKDNEKPLIFKDNKGFTCIITKLSSYTTDPFTQEQFASYKDDYSDLDITCYNIAGYAFK